MTPEAILLLRAAMGLFEVCLVNGISREDLVGGIDRLIEEQEARKDILMNMLNEGNAED